MKDAMSENMNERAREYLLSLGYSEAEVEETLANATEEELEGLIPEREPQKPRQKPKQKRKSNSINVEHTNVTPVRRVVPVSSGEFDPVKAATNVIDDGNKEQKNVVKYTITPVWKLTICSDVEKITFNAIKEELKSVGGKWSDEINGFWFDIDPSNLF